MSWGHNFKLSLIDSSEYLIYLMFYQTILNVRLSINIGKSQEEKYQNIYSYLLIKVFFAVAYKYLNNLAASLPDLIPTLTLSSSLSFAPQLNEMQVIL